MAEINVYEILKKRVLVTRDSARMLEKELSKALADNTDSIVLDFHGVEGVTPSFLDQTLSIIDKQVSRDKLPFRVIVKNPPTHLSSKFIAVARGHNLSTSEERDGAWIIS